MKKEHILTLLNTPKIGNKSCQFIIENFQNYIIENNKDLTNVVAEANKLNKRIPVVSENDINTGWNESQIIIESSEKFGVEITTYADKDYPSRYIKMPNAPVVLYYKGDKRALNNDKAVAIIGTREPTEYGYKAGERLSEIFAHHNFTVVSGLATGCDTAAHKGCLKGNGITVAVMAGGLDKIYPKENNELAEEIISKGGCLISEYPVGMKPRANFFVERDRLQSGLSQAVIVVETDIKGGTMHTVKFSQEQDRFLAALAGHPERYENHPKIQGNKWLIFEQKAKKLSTSEDINVFISFLMHKNLHSDKNNWIKLLRDSIVHNKEIWFNADGSSSVETTLPNKKPKKGGDQTYLNF